MHVKSRRRKDIDMKKSTPNRSPDPLASAIRNSQKEAVDEAVKWFAEFMKGSNKRLLEGNKKLMEDNNKSFMKDYKRLMEDNKREIVMANRERNAKIFERMEKILAKELKQDIRKYMGMYFQNHEGRIRKLEKRISEK